MKWRESYCCNKDQMEEIALIDYDSLISPCQSIEKVIYEYEELDIIQDDWFELGKNKSERYMKIAFKFNDPSFMVIKQVRAFNIESLIGNSGGYVGGFTGFALIQLPNLIDIIIRFSKKWIQHLKPIKLENKIEK